MPDPLLFTIFTPTYNRAHTLHRVFDSLRAQTLRNFEWLVVDDGSTDGTKELIDGWIESADFPVRYLFQDHAGKHVAYNRALIEARGLFFANLDSDDALASDTLEKMHGLWHTIPQSDREVFYSVGGLSCDQNGKIIGDEFPTDIFDADLRELRYVHHIKGDKWSAGLTAILRRYPFPEAPKTQFIPEGLILYDVAKAFGSRWLNEVTKIYYVDDAETGSTLSKRASLRDNAAGRWYYYVWLLNNDLSYFFYSPLPFLKAAVMLPIVAQFSGRSFASVLTSLEKPSAKALVLLALPFASLLYTSDRIRAVIKSQGKV